MKYNRKNGFTLVELLAVIVILAIVLMIAVPGVLSIINKTKQKGYESQLKMIKEAARNYVTSESSKVEWVDNGDGTKKLEITLKTLQESGYLDKKLIDPRDKSEITCATVNVKRETNNQISYDVDATSCMPTDPKCFTFSKEEQAIMDYDFSCPKDVKIPSQIDGIEVTALLRQAFRGNYENKITSVTIPNSITTIGEYVFDNNNISTVVLPTNLKTIEQNAFSSNELTNVTIPDSVTEIEWGAFEDNQLTNIQLSSNLKTIGKYAFANNQLASLEIPPSVTTIEGGAFRDNQLPEDQAFIYARNSDGSEDRSTLIGYGGKERTNLIIPNNVTTIAKEAIATHIDNLTIPDSVTTIERYALDGVGLKSVNIPSSVKTIGWYAFSNNQLKSLTLPAGITMERYVFSENQLTNLVLEEGITKIENNTFSNNKLTTITLPSSLKSIDSYAFSGNPLTSIIVKGKTSLSGFTSLAAGWYSGSPTITFEP